MRYRPVDGAWRIEIWQHEPTQRCRVVHGDAVIDGLDITTAHQTLTAAGVDLAELTEAAARTHTGRAGDSHLSTRPHRPGPVVTISRAVAVAAVHGPGGGLAALGTLHHDERLGHGHRLDAVRGHLLELAGDAAAARDCYLRAARMTASLPEQRYLTRRAARLPGPSGAP